MKSPHSRRGATLLVTLGILSVLSVMVVAFLVTARLHRQVTASQQHRFAARNHIEEGLHLAIKMVEESFTYPNYTGAGTDMPNNAYLTEQRVAPVGQWFAKDYAITNKISRDIAFQSKDVLASPASSNGPTVNLLSPKVLGLVPAALTNGLQLSLDKTPVFRSGWQVLENIDNNDLSLRLNSTQVRVAFTVFNCSGFLDANYFVSGPTTQKLPRVCFCQADVTNWLPEASASPELSDRFKPLGKVLALDDPNESPFFHLSYDPGPDLYPLHYDCFETCSALGTFAFGSGLSIDLNTPLISQVLKGATALTQNNALNKIRFSKYNLNSVTNFFQLGTQSTETAAPWFNDANFKARWLDTVVYLLNMMRNEESSDTRYKWNNSSALAWTIANFMDEDRIPQVTDYPTAEAKDPVISTRANYAVEDVPLINKISIFSIFDPEHPGDKNPEAPQEPSYYFDGDTSNLSNHYAVAVELWYPFAPNEPPPDSACYVGIYTNEADVVTTTNRPWTGNELRDWFRWNTVDSSNTVMQTLFTQWGKAYLGAVGLDTTNHPLWQVVSYEDDLWFTTAQTNHPYWPVPETNGTVNLAATPVWQAFFPDTFTIVTTNGTVVTTNVVTHYTTTNEMGETVYVTPLPMTAVQSNSLLDLFAMLPTNSTTELYDYLLLSPNEFEDWDKLMTYFNEYPMVMNSLLPSNAEPTLGFMTEKDRHALWPDIEPEIVQLDDTYGKPETTKDFRGYFWTIYPKQTVSFKKVTTESPSTPQGGSSTEPITTTNYYALGDFIPGKDKRNTIWVRPAVTIIPASGSAGTPLAAGKEEEGDATADVIVDEALLTHQNDRYEVPVWGWTSVTNLCIPDPRQNAFAKDWRNFPDGKRWEDVINTIELNTGVKELPFIHFNKPFTAIGDIGYIFASYTNAENVATAEETRPYDTITFSTRSGSALLDIFTLHPTNAPMRGLVQANTEQRPVIQALSSDVSVGWTNSVSTQGLKPLRDIDNKLDTWVDLYTDALTNSPYSMGWRSFADMMPNLSTNKTLKTKNVWNSGELLSMHDYTEDVLRGIVDKVSFRQNVFVIIVAAQALSPASTPNHAVVLADQRAAVTVLRDAYTGRWTVHEWTWLTE